MEPIAEVDVGDFFLRDGTVYRLARIERAPVAFFRRDSGSMGTLEVITSLDSAEAEEFVRLVPEKSS
jgi:hypothetical protein